MLKSITLANITALPNYRTIDTDNGEFADLVASIKQDEVLQSVLVRPNKKKPGHYELIAGNRRFLASIEAGKKDIPAKIKDIADDDVIVFQTKENLQRKDVHAMDEAAGFKAYQHTKKCDVKELAAVFAKNERYITHRLALNNLIPDLQKEFLSGKLSVAQAELFAKLNPEQQKELKQSSYRAWDKKYNSVDVIKESIETKFLLKLSSAPWKLDDAELIPVAGSCKECTKRTGCQGLLFDGMVKDDRCLDGSCYKFKSSVFFKNTIEKIVTENPEIKFLKNGDPDKEALEYAKKYNIPVLDNYSWQVSENKTIGYLPVKCFVISGTDKGKVKTVYVAPDSKAAAKASKGDTTESAITSQIIDIKYRLTRGKELDHEKEQEEIIKQLRAIAPDDKLVIVQEEQNLLKAFTAFMLLDSAGMPDDDFLTQLNLVEDKEFDHDKNPFELKNRLIALSHVQLANLLKEAMLHKFAAVRQKSAKSYFMRDLAAWFGVDVTLILSAQNEIAKKREANAQKKIDALQATAKPAAPEKTKVDATVSKPVKPAKKKATKTKINVGAEIIKTAGKIIKQKDAAADKIVSFKNARKKILSLKKPVKKSVTKSKKKAV